MTDISLPPPPRAGLISFLSPCVLPLAPPYLCYLAGTSLEALADEGEAAARGATSSSPRCCSSPAFRPCSSRWARRASAFGALLRQWSHVAVDRRRDRHHRDGRCIFSALFRIDAMHAREAASRSTSRRACGAPI